MDMMQIIKTRKSVRTFNDEKLSKYDIEDISSFANGIRNPYDIPVEFTILNSEEYGLSSPVIEGEEYYIIAKVPKAEHCEEAFGYSFEEMVLYAWSLGIGTTWIGGTLNREIFENAVGVGDDEYMMIVSPLGYPSDNHSKVDKNLREMVKGDERFPYHELFFEEDFNTSLESVEDCLEAVVGHRQRPTGNHGVLSNPARIIISMSGTLKDTGQMLDGKSRRLTWE